MDAAARGLAHAAVGEPAAGEGTGDGGELPVERGGDPGFALTDAEFGFEDGGHPVAHDPTGEGGEGEVEDEEDERGVGEESGEGAGARF